MNNDAIVVELDKPRTLKFRRKELKMLEVIFKSKIAKIKFEDLGIDDLTKMIHAGLVHEDSDLTLEQAETLIDDYLHFGILVEKVMEAFTISMAGPKVPTVEGTEAEQEVKN